MRTVHPRRLLITIDGPSGVGKSTVAKSLAARLGYLYLDTGALYRVIAWKIQQEQIDPTNLADVQSLLSRTNLQLVTEGQGFAIRMDGQLIDPEFLRTPAISQLASTVAAVQPVRDWLLPVQRGIDKEIGIVAEGRDMGTRVFPHADQKFFLDADLEVRASRRQQELAQKGKSIDLHTVREDMELRDTRDRTRTLDPLRPAPDAMMIDTSQRSLNDVVGYMMTIITDRL